MEFFKKMERRFGGWAIENLTLYIVVGQVLAWVLIGTNNKILDKMQCYPEMFSTEPWRVISFIFVPFSLNIISMLVWTYIFYSFGSTLERVWGAFYYNLYIIIGFLTALILNFLPFHGIVTSMFLIPSVLLAFAYLFPAFEILVMFILPVKMKWIGMIAGAYLANNLMFGPVPNKLFAMASLISFLVFFGRDMVRRLRNKEREVKRKSEKRKEVEMPFHVCAECGATDISHSDREFRYRGEVAICSECLASKKDEEA